MRFIFQLLLGMILFNAMLIIFAPYFPYHSVEGVDVSEKSSYADYQNFNFMGLIYDFLWTFVTSFFVTMLAAKLAGGNLPTSQLLGACLVVSVFIGLWAGLTSPIVGLKSSYPDIAPFYNIFTIVLGIVVVISVVEIFTGKGDETA